MTTRRSLLKSLSLTGVLASLRTPFSVFAQPQSSYPSVMGDDRWFWASTLHKIVNPVIKNLAEGTLVEKMPLETPPNYFLKVKKVTYLEAVGRTLAGVAPWLALPDDDTPEGRLRKQLKADLLRGLPRCVDPKSPDYLNFRTEGQPIVDAAFVAHGFLRAPNVLWQPLDDLTKKRFVEEFKSLRDRKPAYSNWLLFSGITEAFLLSIGEQADPFRIDIAIKKMKEWYVGDGWYSDGDRFAMDYYNSFVIHPMLVDMLKICVEHKMATQNEYDEALKRMVRHADFQERLLSPEGTFPVFGRSMTYRAGAFQVLAQTALMEQLPEHIAPAQVRSGLTKMLRQFFEGSQNFDKNGWLLLGFNGSQPMIADAYTSTGSLYLTTLGFLPLGLPATHRFWTDPAADWTAKKAWAGQSVKKDYRVGY
ncbi:MAG: DUF2264 domain-containing protein [Saprospiraceae bacterium]|nr:DUF2264 domain-containing protein [Saprospiraceae bacterium]